MFQILQVAVALILFTNKVFVLIERKTGWLLGAIGCALAITYLYVLGLYVFTVLEFGLVILTLYAFFKGKNKKPRTEFFIRLVIVIAMVIMTIFAFAGKMTMYELAGSILLLFGTYYLSHEKKSLGWALSGIAHVLTAYLGYYKNQQFFADFQIASALVSLAGTIGIKKLI